MAGWAVRRWPRARRSRCAASSPRRSSFRTCGGTARRTRTTSASRCPTSWPLPRAADDADNPLRFVYGNEGAPGISTGSPSGSVCRWSTGSAPARAGWRSRAPRTPRTARWARWSTASPSSTSTPASHARPVSSANSSTPRAAAGSAATTATRRPRPSGWRGGVYHSGDLAYRDENGYAYFAGRHGDWMRVDGENLGTAPIERILMRYPDVTEAAVYAIPDPAVGDRVMAALVLPEGAAFDPDKFRDIPRRAARSRPQAVAGLRPGRHRPAPHRDVQGRQTPTVRRRHRLR